MNANPDATTRSDTLDSSNPTAPEGSMEGNEEDTDYCDIKDVSVDVFCMLRAANVPYKVDDDRTHFDGYDDMYYFSVRGARYFLLQNWERSTVQKYSGHMLQTPEKTIVGYDKILRHFRELCGFKIE